MVVGGLVVEPVYEVVVGGLVVEPVYEVVVGGLVVEPVYEVVVAGLVYRRRNPRDRGYPSINRLRRNPSDARGTALGLRALPVS